MLPHIFRYEISPHVSVNLECSGILHCTQSSFQKIEVVESLDFGRMLVLDGVINLTERDEFIYHEMLVHVPLFSHPNPMKILIVGGGDGGTAREALRHGVVNRVQQVEIDGGVIAVSKRYFPSLGLALEDPKVNILLMDGVEYLREPEEKFDIILVDSTDPVVKQSEGLFTVSFYRDCLNALTEQGILAAQVGDTFFETNLVLSVFAKLKRVFPVVRMYLAPIPSYTLVPYSFAFCSKTVQPELGLGFERFGGDFQVRYYNTQVHHAAFALPEDLKREFER
jgi:spermidine synthase